MNKKGQVLVAFILLLPVIILFMGLLYDFGTLGYKKKQAVNIVEDAVKYGVYHIKDSDTSLKMEELLKTNLKNIENLKIEIKDDTVKIDVIIKEKGMFSKLFDKNLYRIRIEKIGYLNEGVLKIEG